MRELCNVTVSPPYRIALPNWVTRVTSLKNAAILYTYLYIYNVVFSFLCISKPTKFSSRAGWKWSKL